MSAIKSMPVETQQKVDYTIMKEVDAAAVFPQVFEPGEKKIRMRVNRHPEHCQASNPNYVPNPHTLKLLLNWWFAPTQRKPFGLHGETGTGKTELLLYVADHLNEPVFLQQCTSATMPEDFEGSRLLIDGQTPFKPAPALTAYSIGGLLIFDELDKLNLAAQAALHGLVEGKPWLVTATGKTHQRHPLCRIAATGNTMGEGGNEFYVSSQRMDDALRSRIGWVKTFYPDEATELKILKAAFPQLPLQMSRVMVKIAKGLRDARVGADGKGVSDPIGCICSTRTLVDWAFYTMTFGKQALWRTSLDFAMAGSVNPESQSQVDGIIQRIFEVEDKSKTITVDSKVEEIVAFFKSKK